MFLGCAPTYWHFIEGSGDGSLVMYWDRYSWPHWRQEAKGEQQLVGLARNAQLVVAGDAANAFGFE